MNSGATGKRLTLETFQELENKVATPAPAQKRQRSDPKTTGAPRGNGSYTKDSAHLLQLGGLLGAALLASVVQPLVSTSTFALQVEVRRNAGGLM